MVSILYIVPSVCAIFDDITISVWRLFGKERDLQRADLDVLDQIDHLPPKLAEKRAEELLGKSS
jgi:hypothetical protein